MRRFVVLVALGLGLLALAACGDDDDAVVETTSPEPPPSSTSTSSTSPPTTAGSTTAPPTGVTVAEAGEWRLVVTEPIAGATIGRTTQLCLETTGPDRQPVIVFDVALLQSGTSSGSTPVRVDGRLGRSPVLVALPSVPAGPYDLSVQLVADGDQVENVTIKIPITLSDNVPTDTACE